MVVPLWRCPILKPLSAKLPPKSETAPHPGWQDGTILGPGASEMIADHLNHPQLGRNQSLGMISCPRIHMRPLYDI